MASISDNRKKRGRGRPPTGIGKPVGLRLYRDLEQRIDAWAKGQADRPGRPEAIRRLLEQALPTAAPSAPAKAGSRQGRGSQPGKRLTRSATKMQPLRNARNGNAASSKGRVSSAACATISRKERLTASGRAEGCQAYVTLVALPA
jgi:hypothetical protein